MKLFKIFSKEKQDSVEKSYSPLSIINHLLSYGHKDLAAHVQVAYSQNCESVSTAIEMIVTHLSSIEPKAYDIKKEEFVDHPVIDLLKKPGHQFKNTKELFEAIASFMLITGDDYLAINSIDKSSEPKSLIIYPPQRINYTQGELDIVTKYSVTTSQTTGKILEYKLENIKGENKYFAQSKTGAISELVHSGFFNPESTRFSNFGQAPLLPLYHVVEQQLAANTHNLGLLKNGATVGGIFTTEQSLTADQIDKFKKEADEFYKGEQNAGKIVIAANGIEFKTTGQTNKDMDFLALKKEGREAIFNKFKIPLPLISPETMTLANLEAANLILFDNAILPLADKIFADLTYSLMPRYKNSENIIITYDPADISALESRRLEQLKIKAETGLYTLNELRQLDGAHAVTGGNEFYRSSTDKVIAIDQGDSSNTLDIPQDEKIASEAAKDLFIKNLSVLKNESNEPLYTAEQIKRMSNEYGL
jgi:HK97 family phage portal protein